MHVAGASREADCLQLARDGQHLSSQKNYREAIEHFERALGVGTKDLNVLSSIYSQLGNLHFLLRDYTNAIKYHEFDATLSEVRGDKIGQITAYSNLARSWLEQESYDTAIKFFELQLEVTRGHTEGLQQLKFLAKVFNELGSAYKRKGEKMKRGVAAMNLNFSQLTMNSTMLDPFQEDLKRAVHYFEEQLKVARQLADEAMCGRAYGNLGTCFYLMRDYENAVRWHADRLTVAQKLKDRNAMRRAHTNLGNAYIYLRDLEQAIVHHRLALSLACESSDKFATAHCFYTLANAQAIAGDYNSASENHLKHLDLARKLTDEHGEAKAYSSLAFDFRKLDELSKAAYFYAMNRRISKKLADNVQMQQSHASLREIFEMGGIEVKDGEISLDFSADPAGYPLRLSPSLRSLHSAGSEGNCSSLMMDGSGGQFDRSESIPSRASTESKVPKGGQFYTQDEFFDMLTRMQGDRLDEQRCEDPLQNAARRLSTVSFANTLPPPSPQMGKDDSRKRRKSIIGRIRSSVFQPLSASTPLHKRLSITSLSSLRGSKSRKDLRSRASSPGRASLASLSEACEQDTISGRVDRSHAPPALLDFSNLSAIQSSGEEALFRVPDLPIVRKGMSVSTSNLPDVSMQSAPTTPALARKQNLSDDEGSKKMKTDTPEPPPRRGKAFKTDSFVDLLLSANSRRMDDQRSDVVVLPGLIDEDGVVKETIRLNATSEQMEVDKSVAEVENIDVDKENKENVVVDKVQQVKEDATEDKENAGGKPKKQKKASKPKMSSTIPEDDISALIFSMQNGRMDEQRAVLKKTL